MAKITKRTVDAAAPKSDRYLIWDDALPGFGLLVLPTGVKSYVFQYRSPEGRSRRMTLGKHGGDLTAEQARTLAEKHRNTVKFEGGDPLAEKRGLKQSPTCGELFDDYLASEKFADKAASTQDIDRGRIERHLRPLLGSKHVHLLSEEDVRRAMKAIRTGKTAARIKTKTRGLARVTGGPGAAKMCIDLLSTILRWGKVEPNPCARVETGASGERDIILEDASEYARLFATLAKMETEQRITCAAADAIRLIALTGCRRGEAAGLRWRHVDLKEGRIEFPPTQHKTGKKTKKPRIITLPTAAQAVIARQPEGKAEDLVFKPAKGEGSLQLSKVWRLRRKRKDGTIIERGVAVEAELPEGIGLHGLRHSIGTLLASDGASTVQIMEQLGHHQVSTTIRYIHLANKARAALAEKAATAPVAGMAAADGGGGEVVALAKKGGKR